MDRNVVSDFQLAKSKRWLVHTKDYLLGLLIALCHCVLKYSVAKNVNKYLKCLHKLVDNKESKIFGFGLTFEVYIKVNNQCFS